MFFVLLFVGVVWWWWEFWWGMVKIFDMKIWFGNGWNGLILWLWESCMCFCCVWLSGSC